MPHQVLALAGSPRRRGNSEALLDSALAGIAAACGTGAPACDDPGHASVTAGGGCATPTFATAGGGCATPTNVRKLVINELTFAPCQNCGFCSKTGYCRFAASDDMKSVYEALDASDRFVIASPIYFANISAQLKGLIDRCQAIWARKYLLKQKHANPDRKALFLCCGGFKHDRFYKCARQVIAAWCIVLDIRLTGELFFHSIDARGEIEKHPTALADAFRAGSELMQ